MFPRSAGWAALCFAAEAYHAVEAAVEAADAKDPTLPHAPVEAADEAADAEDRLTLEAARGGPGATLAEPPACAPPASLLKHDEPFVGFDKRQRGSPARRRAASSARW